MQHSNLPPLTRLRAFEASSRHLSFTRAAAGFHLTQIVVSQHVRSLEANLGRDLFPRKTRAFIGAETGRDLTLQGNMAFSVFWPAPRQSRRSFRLCRNNRDMARVEQVTRRTVLPGQGNQSIFNLCHRHHRGALGCQPNDGA
nr:LysR family transcriptional regulator [Labrenzia sp. DG1229]